MGIMFAPGTEQGVARDLDWSFLNPLPVDEDVHPYTRTNQARQRLDIEMSPIDKDDLTTFGTRKNGKAETSGDPEVEDAGIKLHYMIKEMMLEDKKDSKEK